jgi:hypothetical protein
MPKVTCQLNLTLDIPIADHLERLARERYLNPSGIGRLLVEQRLRLETAGWKFEDQDLPTLLETISRLPTDRRDALEGFLRGLAATNAASEPST